MQLDLMMVFQSLVGLFLLIGLGIFLAKSGILPTSIASGLSAFILKVTMPCTCFLALVQQSYDPAFLRDAVLMFLTGFLVVLLTLAVSVVLSNVFSIPRSRRGVWAFSATFSNYGFMGFPIILSLLGSYALALAAIFSIVFNLIIYSLGDMVISRDVASSQDRVSLKKIILTPLNFGILMSLVVYFGRIPLPAAISVPITHLSNTTTPMSLIVTGILLSDCNLREVITDKSLYGCAALRLLVYPFLSLFLLKSLPFLNPMIVSVIVIIMSMPTAASATFLSETKGADSVFGSKVILITSILCIVTLPLLCVFL